MNVDPNVGIPADLYSRKLSDQEAKEIYYSSSKRELTNSTFRRILRNNDPKLSNYLEKIINKNYVKLSPEQRAQFTANLGQIARHHPLDHKVIDAVRNKDKEYVEQLKTLSGEIVLKLYRDRGEHNNKEFLDQNKNITLDSEDTEVLIDQIKYIANRLPPIKTLVANKISDLRAIEPRIRKELGLEEDNRFRRS